MRKRHAVYRRKQFFINPNFQLSFLVYTCGIALLVTVIYFLMNQYFFSKFNELGRSMGLAPGHVFFHFLQEQKSAMDVLYAITSLVVTMLLLGWGIYYSHRIAGPIFKIENHIRDALQGEAQEGSLQLRKTDYFHELARGVNGLVKRLKPPH